MHTVLISVKFGAAVEYYYRYQNIYDMTGLYYDHVRLQVVVLLGYCTRVLQAPNPGQGYPEIFLLV
mgnify:CR=1 FL=1